VNTAAAPSPSLQAAESALGADRLTPAADFNRLARVYRWMEWASFGPFLWWCRCAFLHRLPSSRRALILGDGDGRFTARLLRDHPALRVDAVDASEAMLRSLAERALPNAQRLQAHHADARAWNPGRSDYDLIVTHFFLDCLETGEVLDLALRMHADTAPGALWIVSEFAVPQGWFGRWIARPIVTLLYWAFGWMTHLRIRALPDHAGALRRSGFVLLERKHWLAGLLVSEMWQRR
jgi:Methyltransferase domain